MSYVDRFSRTITVRAISADTVDDYGTPTYSETETEVLGHWRQLSADENGQNVDSVAWRVYLPAGTDVDAGDRLDLAGTLVEVIGSPQDLYDPRRGLVVGMTIRAEAAA